MSAEWSCCESGMPHPLDGSHPPGGRLKSDPVQVNRTARQPRPSADSGERVWVVVNHRKDGRVHGITCDLAEAERWIGNLMVQYDNDPLAASLTVGLVYPDNPVAQGVIPTEMPSEPERFYG